MIHLKSLGVGKTQVQADVVDTKQSRFTVNTCN